MPEIDPNQLVEPNATAPEAAPQEDNAPPPMPAPLLKIPAVHGLLVGQPGAFSLPIKESKSREDLQDLVKYRDWLQRAGMAVYSAMDGKTGVVFNQLYIHPEELKAADVAGQLHQIAPPFDQINHSIAKSGRAHPSLNAGPVPTGLKAAPIPQPPQMAQVPPVQSAVPPLPASAQRKVMTAQISASQPGSPTSGPNPGAGRLLNQILKPVV